MKTVDHFPEFIKNLPEVDVPIDGARGWMIQGEKQQVVFVEFTKTIEVPAHVHQDQWEFVLDGKVTLRKEGETQTYIPGESFIVPEGLKHGATVHAGYKAMIIFNAPDRYKAK